MKGIYKITSPSNKVYIGQSINVESRFKSYKNLSNCSNQIKLINSLKKYGPENHSFEILEECRFELLNERERYWQEYYNSCGDSGLNLILTGTSQKKSLHSEESKNKIKEARKKQKIKHSEETKIKIGKSNKGKKLSEEHIKILKQSKSEEHKQKMRGPRPEYRRAKEKIKCTHCDKWGAPNVMYRFHFDRCGFKEELKKIDCPHCKKSGSISNMKRWHFDNCKSLSDKNKD
jgi:group I intron endonuclease